MFSWFKSKNQAGPDYSRVDSREKAEDLWRKGELFKVFLMPLEFGGADFPPNVIFLPEFAASIKESTDKNVIAPLAAQGTISHYSAIPEYQGRSVVPIALTVSATEPGNFSTTINIWGEALGRDLPQLAT